MGNHQKLRIGVKVNAEVYSCQGRISDDKTHTGRTFCGSDSARALKTLKTVLIKLFLFSMS